MQASIANVAVEATRTGENFAVNLQPRGEWLQGEAGCVQFQASRQTMPTLPSLSTRKKECLNYQPTEHINEIEAAHV